RREVEQFAIKLEYGAEAGAAQAHRTPGDSIEHGLEVSGRAADDTQDLARRRLLLQRLGQLAVADLQLREEPDVLNGDHGLVGEGLEQRDLRVGKRSSLGAPYHNHPDGTTVTQHRHRDEAASAHRLDDAQPDKGGIFLYIRDMDDGAVQNGTAGRAIPARRPRKRPVEGLESCGCMTMMRNEVDELPVELKHAAELTITQPHGALGDHVEDRLDISRRAADDA